MATRGLMHATGIVHYHGNAIMESLDGACVWSQQKHRSSLYLIVANSQQMLRHIYL